MGSYYDLRIAGYSILSNKWQIEDEVLSLFVEADKIHSPSAPDLPSECANVHTDNEFFGYCSTVAAISDRLDVMGFTPQLAKTNFCSLLRNEIEQNQQRAHDWIKRSEKTPEDETYLRLATNAQQELHVLSELLTFESWSDAVGRIMQDHVRWKMFDADKPTYTRELDVIEDHILNPEHGGSDGPPFGFYCSDLRFLIRAVLLCSPPSGSVVLDCTDMVNAGYFDADDPITTHARASITAGARTVEKILVLTEGASDSRILRLTLEAIYPHLREFVSFLDHEQFAVPGGTGNLMNLLRGFAGAGVSNRVLALFDNDAAGSVQIAHAKKMTLPENFRVLQLPHLSFAELYPALGPTGLTETDVNGSACSIELYLGRTALTDESGTLTPIQWTGFEKALMRYQGELLNKQAVQKRYLQALSNVLAETENIKLVFQSIFAAFHEP